MINIEVFSNERAWSQRLKKKELFFKKVCEKFPNKYQFPNKKVNVSLLLSNNKNIKKLNKKFRNKDKSTDILSFPFNKKIKISKEIYIGDIIISYNYINKPKSQKTKFFKEKLIKIFIHGFLHLLSFNHIKEIDYKRMSREEEHIFQSVVSKIKIN